MDVVNMHKIFDQNEIISNNFLLRNNIQSFVKKHIKKQLTKGGLLLQF